MDSGDHVHMHDGNIVPVKGSRDEAEKKRVREEVYPTYSKSS